jgi:hypothetical protein
MRRRSERDGGCLGVLILRGAHHDDLFGRQRQKRIKCGSATVGKGRVLTIRSGPEPDTI